MEPTRDQDKKQGGGGGNVRPGKNPCMANITFCNILLSCHNFITASIATQTRKTLASVTRTGSADFVEVGFDAGLSLFGQHFGQGKGSNPAWLMVTFWTLGIPFEGSAGGQPISQKLFPDRDVSSLGCGPSFFRIGGSLVFFLDQSRPSRVCT